MDAVSVRWRTLPPDELPGYVRERLHRLRSAKARDETLAGLWLLREALGQAGWRMDLSCMHREPGGRPVLPGGPAFSISHTDGLAACAISGDVERLGLDVERVRHIDPARMKRFLDPGSRAGARHDPAVFFRAWTAREAAVKATGRVGLRRVARVRLEGDTATIDDQTLYLQRPNVLDGFELCVACEQRTTRINPEGVI